MTFSFKTKAKTACLGLQVQPFKKTQRLTGYVNTCLKLKPSRTTFKVCVFSDKAKKLLLGRWVSITSDQKRRNHYLVQELEKILLKSYGTSTRSQRSELERWKGQNGLRHFGFHQMLVTSNYRKAHKKLGTVTRVRNRCVLSGRAHILRRLGLSRICFRNLAGWGFIPGLTKI